MQGTTYKTVRPAAYRGAGTLLLRGDTYYAKFSADGRQVKKALGTTAELTENQAARKLGKLVATFKPKERIAEKVTVSDAAEAMIAEREDDGLKTSTARGYRSVAKRLKKHFGAMTCDRVGRREVERFAARLSREGLSRATRWHALWVLDATLRHAEKRGWATGAPRIEKPRGRDPRGAPIRFLHPRELERVLDAYDDDPVGRVMRTLTLTAAWTGLRRGELLGLRWSSVDFGAQKLHVDESYVVGKYDTPKSGRGRSVPLPARVAGELRTQRLATPYSADADPVFAHPEGTGRPINASSVSAAFAAAVKASGAPARRFHDLRHTYAVHAAKAGIPLTDLREWLGHADLATTSIYARYCPREGEAERIERAMTAA